MTSNSSFADLGVPARLISNLSARGITDPFPIQVSTLPDTLAGLDVLGRGKTGSGKTLAFSIPLVVRLADAKRRPAHPTGLVLAPTRELATQISAALEPLAASYGLKVTTIFGGVSQSRQESALRAGADIVVACPGRLEDLMRQRLVSLDSVEITVLDEADHMADLGFLPAVTRILDATPSGGQRMLFSATLDRGVGQLVTSYVSDPALHAVPTAVDSSLAEHRMLVLSAQDKVPVATEIASREGRTLFFVRTKHGADRLAKQLGRAGISAAAIHGDRNQNQRQRALDGFAAGDPRVLVATDVAARGIHVDDVDLVVQYDPPNDAKDYLHRSGRTARAGASGLVVVLAEHGQVRDLERMHDAAGITADRHEVAAGHHVVRQIATSGTPIPPAPAPVSRTPRHRSGTRGAGPSRPAARSRQRGEHGSRAGRSEGREPRPVRQ